MLVHITIHHPPWWMQGHVIILRCSANDAEPEFHFRRRIPGTTKLRGWRLQPQLFWALVWIVTAMTPKLCAPPGAYLSIPVKLNDVNKLTTIGQQAAVLFYELPSKVTFWVSMFPYHFQYGRSQSHFPSAFGACNDLQSNAVFYKQIHTSICTDLQIVSPVGVTGISIHICG